ncbi:MAG: hypothetical protein GJT30_06910 [Geobacter sp.]|nr:hypothetical protein [Geobacter sp.]
MRRVAMKAGWLFLAALLLLSVSGCGGSGTSAPPPAAFTITLATNDLVYNPFDGYIYASVPSREGVNGNSVALINPVSGAVGPYIFVGSEPGKLALSDDGSYLYVALDGSAEVARLDLLPATPVADIRFSLGSDPTFGPYYVDDMAVLPSNPRSVAVSRKVLGVSPRHAGVAVYDDGAIRTTVTPGATGSNVITFAGSPTTLYGYNNETSLFGFYRMAIDASGVTVTDVTQSLISGYNVDITSDGTFIYATSGQVIDPRPATPSLVATIPGMGATTLVAPDPVGRIIFYLTGTIPTIYSYDLDTYVLLGSSDILGISGVTSSLIDLGIGLAFRTDTDQVVVLPNAVLPY